MTNIGPITVARLERCLDILALKMSGMDDGGAACLPLYQRIERDIEERRGIDDVLAKAKARAKGLRQSTVG